MMLGEHSREAMPGGPGAFMSEAIRSLVQIVARRNDGVHRH